VKEDEVYRDYSTQRSDEKCIKIVVLNLKGKYHLEEIGINGRIILKSILKEMWSENVDWIQLAPQDSVHWRTLVNTVINLGIL